MNVIVKGWWYKPRLYTMLVDIEDGIQPSKHFVVK
jgi:hypothetical protein